MSRIDDSFSLDQMDILRGDRMSPGKKRAIVAATLLAVVLGLFAAYRSLEPGVPRIPAERLWIDSVREGEFVHSVHGTGTLVPEVQRWLTAQSVATVERIVSHPGTAVEADSIILELANPDLLDRLASERTALAVAESDEISRRLTLEGQVMDQEASLADLRIERRLAELQSQNESGLVEQGSVSRFAHTQTLMRLEALTERLRLGERRLAGARRNLEEQAEAGAARIEQLRQNVAQLERQIDALRVRAGMKGVVQSVDVAEGKQVVAGTALALVAQAEPLQVLLNVPEAQAKDLEIGMSAHIDMRGATFSGHVARIAPSVQNAAVEVLVQPDGPLPAGARPLLGVDGVVEVERIAGTLTLARPPGVMPDSELNLYRLTEDGSRAVRVAALAGRASADRIEIISGLKAGDRIVLSDVSDWNNPSDFRVQR
jgi:HlyD family secretion protein